MTTALRRVGAIARPFGRLGGIPLVQHLVGRALRRVLAVLLLVSASRACLAQLPPPGPAASLFAGTSPSYTQSGNVFPQLEVELLDASGRIATAYGGVVHFTSSDPLAVLPPDSLVPGGNRTFSVTMNTQGSQTITITDTKNAVLTTTVTVFVMPPGPAGFLVFGPDGTNDIEAGVPFPFVVEAVDDLGHPFSSFNGLMHFSASAANMILLPPDSALTNGRGTFTATLGGLSDNVYFLNVNEAADPKINGRGSFNMLPGLAATFSLQAENRVIPQVGVPFTLDVEPDDAFGNGTTYTGTIHFTSSDPLAQLPPDSTLRQILTVTFGTRGNQTITATATADPSITGTVTLPVDPGTIVVTLPSAVTVGQTFSFTVTVLDSNGSVDTTNNDVVSFSSNPHELFPPPTALKNGAGTFTASFTTAGTHTVTVSYTADPNFQGSGTITAAPLGTSHFAVTIPSGLVGFPSFGVAGQGFDFFVNPEDQFGNPVPTYNGILHFSSSDPRAFLPPDQFFIGPAGDFRPTLTTPGTQTVSVNDVQFPSIAGSANITITPDQFTYSPGLYMFSWFSDFTGLTLNDIFNPGGIVLATWQPSLLQYALSPTFPADTIRPGSAYWMRVSASTTLSDLGQDTNSSQPFRIALATGWNMFGNPFEFNFGPFANLTFIDASGNSHTESDAIQSGLIGPAIWAFHPDPVLGGYEQVTEFRPIQGYWIFCSAPCTMVVPPR